MTDLKFTPPIQKGEQWVVTLHAPAEDIRYALSCISSVPEIAGLQMILNPATPDTAEIRFRGDESWAKIMDYLDLVFTFIPIAHRRRSELGQQASQAAPQTATPAAVASRS